MGSANIDDIAAIGLSLALGLLIGVQRGWTLRNEEPGSRFAGVRTFGLIGLVGGIAGAILSTSTVAATIILGGAAILILLGYAESARRSGKVSGTANLVGLLTLGCGFLATTHQALLATVVAAVTTMLLTMRAQFHGWIEQLSEAEVNAIARFALIAMAILPLLPDRAFGPLDAWNPRQLWMVVVMVSGFSLAGYVATKRLGATRGTIAASGAGAMVSSTAVTAALATRLRDGGENGAVLIAGIAIASTVMLVRVLVLVAVLAPFAFAWLALMVVPAALVSALASVWQLRASSRQPGMPAKEVGVRNPFDIGPALGLMLLVMVLSLVARWVLLMFGDAGLAAVLALSGIVDVDSAIITMGGLPTGTIVGRTAGLVLAAPIMLNTLFKAGVAITLAGRNGGWRAALPLIASVAAGLAMLPLVLGRAMA